jgi:hypothetical protein
VVSGASKVPAFPRFRYRKIHPTKLLPLHHISKRQSPKLSSVTLYDLIPNRSTLLNLAASWQMSETNTTPPRRGRGRGRGISFSSRGSGSSGRGRGRGGQTKASQPSEPSIPDAPIVPIQETTAPVEKTEEEDPEKEVCFICASDIVHLAIAPCNHRTCHICSLRWRALYKTDTCAHCRVSTCFIDRTAANRFRLLANLSYLPTTTSTTTTLHPARLSR